MYQNFKEEKQTGSCEFRGSKKQKMVQQKIITECDSMFVEELHNAVWPLTNVDKFTQLLDACDATYLEAKHGRRQETLIHRYS